ncbi:MAG TPA: RICIN domain-containing protein [Bdellovibrionales bacterium]|nr:RICIN domain-containing protein [Bdellovibrionales bacterium]
MKVGIIAKGFGALAVFLSTQFAFGGTPIVSAHSGLCADVASWSTANSAKVQQWECHGGNNQNFELVATGSYYRIRAVHSGLCLDVQGASTANGAKVIQYACGSGNNQQFSLQRDSSGRYALVARHSGRCLDIAGWSTSNGTQLQQWDCHYGDNQKFELTVSGAPAPTPAPAPAPTPAPATSSPYTTINIPGRIQAEHFDNGGAGVAYSDSSSGNNGNVTSRGGDVDLETSSDGTPNVGWIADGEWLQYTVNVTVSGSFTLSARVAAETTSGLFDVYVDGAQVVNDAAVPYTGDWQSWTSVSRTVNLTAGQRKIRFVAVRGGFNFNHLDVASGTAPAPAPAGSSLKIMTFNVKHGESDVAAQAQFIANQNVDVVLLQEVPDYSRPRHYLEYRDRVQSLTGRTWYYIFDYGVMLMSRIPFNNSERRSLGGNSWGGYRAGVRAEITVGGQRVNIWGTHLDIACCWHGGYVIENMNNLLSWAAESQFAGTRRIIGGDLNSNATAGDPLQRDAIARIRGAGYTDTLVEIYGSDSNCPPTNNGWRPDAIYRSSGFRTRASRVVDTGWLSDHDVIVTELELQ